MQKIACDIDGVLVDFHTAYTLFLAERYNITVTPEEFSAYSEKLWGKGPEYDRRLQEFYDSKHGNFVLLHEGAQTTIKKLVAAGFWIEAITSRPSHMQQRTREELDKHFPGAFKEIDFSVNKDGKRKIDLCKKRGLSVLIEDISSYAAECSDAGMRVLLFDRPWNRTFDEKQHKNIIRVRSWHHIYELLTSGNL